VKSRIIILSLCLAGALALPAMALTSSTAAVENSPPIAENLTLKTYKGVAITSRFAAVDPEGDLVTFQVVDSPARGQVTLDENDPGQPLRARHSENFYPEAENYGELFRSGRKPRPLRRPASC